MRAVLEPLPALAVAVSGGVDSLTLLAFAAHHRGPQRAVRAFHAASAAVPPEATERTRALAASLGVELVLLDVGELSDARYASNPLDRCYTCKSRLYDGIAAAPHARGAVVVSGTNVEDLGDFRPGLRAAEERAVRHPYVEAGLGKAEVRALARALGLGALAELAAQPCLASRVETGIAIDAALLRAVDDVERRARHLLGQTAAVRCRVRAGRAELEVDQDALSTADLPALRAAMAGAALEIADVVPYRKGSAFLRVL
ncbi:MAG: adenine nucleotide alpha hydrolase [Deltaproteobacteria bacterium]|nr:adenine nucleotide alpha hydrolase [Deltaproteobacteria bacterium]